MTCAFCEKPAEAICSSPAIRWVKIKCVDIVAGDRVRRDEEDTAGEVVILDVKRIEPQRMVLVRYRPIRSRTRAYHQEAMFNSMTTALRACLCALPVCDDHRIERGESSICRDHWRAWESVA